MSLSENQSPWKLRKKNFHAYYNLRLSQIFQLNQFESISIDLKVCMPHIISTSVTFARIYRCRGTLERKKGTRAKVYFIN